MEDEIKRWTARRKAAVVLEIIPGKTTVIPSRLASCVVGFRCRAAPFTTDPLARRLLSKIAFASQSNK
jgi:hypothetical protein